MSDKRAMTNGAVLTAHEATVQTVQVEIQVMKVGKKAVTMGLFRQLPHRPVLDVDTLAFQGTPWGRVNYWWDGDERRYHGENQRFLHIVWQADDCLYRAVVSNLPPPAKAVAFREDAQRCMHALYLRLLRDLCPVTVPQQHARRREITVAGGGYTLQVKYGGEDETELRTAEVWQSYTLDPPAARRTRDLADWLARHPGATRPDASALSYIDRRYEEGMRQLQEGEALYAQRGLDTLAPATLWQRYEASLAAHTTYKATWAAQYDALAALPQLFVAV